MLLADSHAHIYLEQFKDDVSEVIDRAREAGVERIFMPNIDHTSIDDMMELAERYPNYCIPMMGLHPCSVDKEFQKELYLVEEWLGKYPFVAVGEIGTDLYWDKTFWQQQQEALKIQLELAAKFDLPFAIHCRDSIDETIQLVKEQTKENTTGVFHCFTGNLSQAKEIVAMGFYLGIGGVSTFKNGGLGEVLSEIDIKHIVLETDSPYLAPVPNRGKRNEPAYLTSIARKIAEEKNDEVEDIASQTTSNTYQLFNYVS